MKLVLERTIHPLSSPPSQPYTVTQLNILHSNIHMPYRTSKGKIEQALHIGTHSTGIEPLGDFPGAYRSSFLLVLLVLHLLGLLPHLRLRDHLLRDILLLGDTERPRQRKTSRL